MIFEHDVVVIGGGMVGASIAAQLSEHASVRLLEMEPQPGFHSTGRSAALFVQMYGNEVVRALTRASRAFFYSPPAGFCQEDLVRTRGVLITARGDQALALERFIDSASSLDRLEVKSPSEARALCPILNTDEISHAVLYRDAADIDVHALHQGYLRLLQQRKGIVTTDAKAIDFELEGDSWSVKTANETLRAKIVVNAAGAWAGEIGRLAGAIDVGLTPFKRTACLIEGPAGQNVDQWPMLLDVEEQFYLKPEVGMLLISPADETLSDACDVQADDLDVAIAVERIERATTLQVRRITHKWAGLRSFVKDRSPVVGYDPHRTGFFWAAALGGYGIQTAPALGRLAASLVLGLNIRDDCQKYVDALAPGRISASDGGQRAAWHKAIDVDQA